MATSTSPRPASGKKVNTTFRLADGRQGTVTVNRGTTPSTSVTTTKK
jgi:hypothetical protein